MKYQKCFIILASIIYLTSCVSTYSALQDLSPGSTKAQVRRSVGRPYKVQRQNGRDVWVYKFKKGSQEYTKDVIFDEGLVQKKGALEPYPNYKQKMLEAESLDDYESNALLYRKQKEAGFSNH